MIARRSSHDTHAGTSQWHAMAMCAPCEVEHLWQDLEREQNIEARAHVDHFGHRSNIRVKPEVLF